MTRTVTSSKEVSSYKSNLSSQKINEEMNSEIGSLQSNIADENMIEQLMKLKI